MKLRPMSEAPTTGPVVEILVATMDRAGCNGWLIAHYAFGGGEDQPPFDGWFYWTGYSFSQIASEKLLGWLPLPTSEESVKEKLDNTLHWQLIRAILIRAIDKEEKQDMLLGFLAEHWGNQVPRQAEFAELQQRATRAENDARNLRHAIRELKR